MCSFTAGGTGVTRTQVASRQVIAAALPVAA
jgi:hypothetical protein